MKIFGNLRKIILLFSVSIGFHYMALAQTADEGSKLFNANCTSCHSINQKVVGPALKNADKKYKEEWIIKWVKNSQELVKAGDPDAVKVFEANNKVPMTSFATFTDIQIKSIIAYIKAESEKAPVASANTSATASADAATAGDDNSSGINWLLVFAVLLMLIVCGLVFDILDKVSEIKGKPTIEWFKINAVLLIVFLIVGMIAAYFVT